MTEADSRRLEEIENDPEPWLHDDENRTWLLFLIKEREKEIKRLSGYLQAEREESTKRMADVCVLAQQLLTEREKAEAELTASQKAQNCLAALYDKTITEREELKNGIREQEKEIALLQKEKDWYRRWSLVGWAKKGKPLTVEQVRLQEKKDYEARIVRTNQCTEYQRRHRKWALKEARDWRDTAVHAQQAWYETNNHAEKAEIELAKIQERIKELEALFIE